MAAMADPVTNPRFDEIDRLVLEYSEVLTKTNRVSSELFARLAAWFSREEIVELCFTVGLSNLVNRVHATFNTDLDEMTKASVPDAAFCPIGR
jgi:alkylhydroperoxidase family enzyme